MIRKTYILSLILLLFCPSAMPSGANPFISMAYKSYTEYADSLEKYFAQPAFEQNDSVWALGIMQQMRETAQTSGDKRWELEAVFFECMYNYYHYWDKPHRLIHSEETLDRIQKIISRARQASYTALQLRGEFFIFTHYWYDLENHEMAFRQWSVLEKLLKPVAAGDFPLKPYYYLRIGVLYSFFDEYEKTVSYYNKVLETPEVSLQQGHLEWTMNELGLIYRDHYKNLEKSDSCFRAILELAKDGQEVRQYLHFTMQERNELWQSLAKGNLGTNDYLRGEYDKAIPLLKDAMEGAIKNNTNNYPYAASKALTIAEIYILKNDFSPVEHYVSLARKWLDTEQNVSRAHNIDLWQKYYQTLLLYYRAKGDNNSAWLYNDSLESAKRIADEEYNMRQLQRAEQEIQQEKLEAEQTISHAYRRNFLIAAAFVVVTLIMLMFIGHYNRRIAEKNRKLVVRLKEQDRIMKMSLQANTDSAEQTDENNARQLLNALYSYLLQNYAGKIDANIIAAELSVSRNRLLEAIKNLTGKTLRDYINTMRLDQARQMLETTDITVELIALDCGFGTVRTFYRLFRESYGITPAQYRKIVERA